MEFILKPMELPIIRDIICKDVLVCGEISCTGKFICNVLRDTPDTH